MSTDKFSAKSTYLRACLAHIARQTTKEQRMHSLTDSDMQSLLGYWHAGKSLAEAKAHADVIAARLRL